ncbi:hypothetical protein CVV68_01425 [Arthrobacter livingstonensis]|uniref:RES domain-containing protein n=1 Tax=Arthrobacter livingstonensis TaxID=670078 RepID=A0A2V5LDM9_9MICC|nr:RES family NAD+ phosphorylase [Arthrobacter livingstonensis]PYI69795.1 hypothetical protein CVV68_01425 [Arthrobacter livingstonensis]
MSSPEPETSPALEIENSAEPTQVWRIGYAPDLWAWPPWAYADDQGLFGGRWDDQLGEFRTIYTAESLLGCFLELLAHFRPCLPLLAELDEIVDDDGSIASYPEAPEGAVGYRWLDGREYSSTYQSGRYCFITHSRSIAALIARYPFAQHGLAAGDVDAALLKDARDRVLTRSIARWLYDLHDQGSPVVDGVRFNSRHGDEIRVWAVFERAGDPSRSPLIQPSSEPARVHPVLPELQEAFTRFGLHWHEG